MEKITAFLRRKNIVLSAKRYGIDALGAMAQGLFCSLLIGTIVKTLGEQAGLPFLVDVGNYASAMSGSAMAVAIGCALQAPPLVLFSLATVGYAANALGSTSLIPNQSGAGGPLAVLFIAVIAAELGKAVSKETKIDILVTPLVTILAGVGLSAWWAPAIGTAATAVGNIIMWATELQPFLMGIVVSVVIGMALTLPISSAAICAAFGLTGLAGGADVILLPEIPFSPEKVAKAVAKRADSGKAFSIVAIAEGAMTVEESKMKKKERAAARGNDVTATNALARYIAEKADVETRVVIPGHIQRGGSPSAYDRVLSTMFGSYAGKLAEQGKFGVTVALVNGKVTYNALSEIAGKAKLVPTDCQEVLTAESIGIALGR